MNQSICLAITTGAITYFTITVFTIAIHNYIFPTVTATFLPSTFII